jgi:hypothetical protein
MTIKEWIETYCRELSGSDPEKELEAIVAQIAQIAQIAKGIEELESLEVKIPDNVCSEPVKADAKMDEQINRAINRLLTLGEMCTPKDVEELRDKIKAIVEQVAQEAYKKGYIQNGLDT